MVGYLKRLGPTVRRSRRRGSESPFQSLLSCAADRLFLGPLELRLFSQQLVENDMSTTVSQMTTSELKEMIEAIIEQKLLELLGDPDEGLPIRKVVRDRLLRQKQAVAAGERGEPFEDVVRRLGLE